MHVFMKLPPWPSCSHLLNDSTQCARLLQICAKTKQPNKGKELHAQLIQAGFQPDIFVANHLVNMYAKCGNLEDAHQLFHKMPERNIVSWTSMISGFSQNGKFERALRFFVQMQAAGIMPTQFAFSSVIQACAALCWLDEGKQVHSLTVKSGFDSELFVGSNLAGLYSVCGVLSDACQVFDEMPQRDEVSWTAMITGYTKNGGFVEALGVFKKMHFENVTTDQHSICSALTASGSLRDQNFGKSLHSCIIKSGFDTDIVVGNALVDMYSKTGDMESASFVFDLNSECQNVVSCSSLIDGYVELDQIERALRIFVESRRKGIDPNEFTFSSLLKACASQAALEQGKQLHAQVIKTQFEFDPFVSLILVDMYGKSGLLDSSLQLFNEIPNPTEIAYNSVMGVFAQHGCGKEAVEIFERMVSVGVSPNEITFVSLLTACSHTGLVQKGLNYFNSMDADYGIKPREEHYSCVIDLLSRAGKLSEAEEFISRMPFEPNAFGWCALLGACRIHGDKERGEIAAKKLMELEPENTGTHVLLSNIYAAAGQWEDVKSVRRMMRDSQVKKLPGYSWVDVNNKTHVFGAEDWSHAQKAEIYEKLESLYQIMKEEGYIPDTGSVSSNVAESLKERLLLHHSERLAVAFALISFPIGKPIIVKKNLRVCVDCHSAMKFISKIAGRKITVRDNSRFHHFVDGMCSCGDYW